VDRKHFFSLGFQFPGFRVYCFYYKPNEQHTSKLSLLPYIQTHPSIHMQHLSKLWPIFLQWIYIYIYILPSKVKENESTVDFLQFESEQRLPMGMSKFSFPVTHLMPYYAETSHSRPFCYDSTECAGVALWVHSSH